MPNVYLIWNPLRPMPAHTAMKNILIPPLECVPPHYLGLKYSTFFDKKYLRTLLLFKKVKILVKECLHTWRRVCDPHIWVSTQRLRSFFSCLDLFFKKSKQSHKKRWKNWKNLKKKCFCFYQAQKLELEENWRKTGGKLEGNWRKTDCFENF